MIPLSLLCSAARAAGRIGFATVVLADHYVEAGDTGRHRVEPGDVLPHRGYEGLSPAPTRAAPKYGSCRSNWL